MMLSAADIQSNEQLQRILSNWKLTPATFAHKISRGRWIPAAHLQYVSARIATGIRRGGARIIVSAPPRHGKSELLSVNTPAWVLEEFPNNKIIMAGYGADLTTGFSRRVRDIFTDKENESLLTTRIRRDASRVEAFLTNKGGECYAVGVGGPITGRGAHVLLIDDYIKEIGEALSPTYREYIWNWFITTAFTRLEPGGSCIIIATRWHSDDLIGRILTNLAEENWEYIKLPALAEENDLIGRPIGEPLFKERYPIERLAELRTTLGPTYWNALFQQTPVDEIKKLTNDAWLNIVAQIPSAELRGMRFARVWDLAATEDGGDYTVGTLMGYSSLTGNVYILDVFRKQLSPSQVETAVKTHAILDGADTQIGIEREPGSAGKHLIHHYSVNVLPGYTVKEIQVDKNKIIRAQPFLAAAENGNVHLLKGDWNAIFSKEFKAFPAGAHDDQVDTAAEGYTLLSGKKVFSASWGRNKKDGSAAKNARAARDAMNDSSPVSIPGSKKPSGRITFGRG